MSKLAIASCAVLLMLSKPIFESNLIGQEWSVGAQSRFAVPTSDEIAAARATLLDARDKLVAKLKESPLGLVVSKDLELNTFENACENPSLDRLDLLLAKSRMIRDKGLQPQVDQLRQSLRRFHAVSLLSLDPTAPSKFASSIETLNQAMASQVDAPLENYQEISKAYEFLSATQLIDDLLPPVAQRFSHPNQRLDLSQRVIDQLLDREIKRPIDIDKNEKGMKISGKGELVAKPSAQFVSDPNKATVNIHFEAEVIANIRGEKSPATVFARSVVNLIGDTTLYLNELGIDVAPPTLAAKSHTCLTGLCLQLKVRVLNQLLNPLVSKIVQKKLTEADPQSAEKTRKEVCSKIEEYRDELIVQINEMLQRFLWRSFDAKEIDSNMRSQTTSNALTWTSEFVGPGQLAAPSPAPTAPAETVIAVQFHESTFNNTDVSVAGRKINEANFTELLFDRLKLARDSEDEDPIASRIPATFTFAEVEPLQLHFDEGLIRGQLRIQAHSFDLKKFSGPIRTVRFTYKPLLTADGFRLERQGEIEFDPGNADQTASLAATMQRFFKPQFVSAGIKGKDGKTPLQVSGLLIDNGWLSVFLATKI